LLNAPVIRSLTKGTDILGDRANANFLVLTGSAVADGLISVFDDAVLVGTTQADAYGSWHFTTDLLADGTHSFTATVTDSSRSTGEASAQHRRQSM
jgi:hypothetical protein